MTPDRLSSRIVAALDGLVDEDVLTLPAGVTTDARLRPSRRPDEGDWTTSAALVVAGDAARPALEVAALLADRLRDTAGIRSVQVTPPGFVNVRLDVDWSVAIEARAAGPAYGVPGLPLEHPGDPFHERPGRVPDSDAAPCYLVQRAHARACSLLRGGRLLGITPDLPVAGAPPPSAAGEALLRLVAAFPEVVATAERRREAHRLGRHLELVAAALLDLDPLVLPRGDDAVTGVHRSGLLLADAARVVLANGLGLLGLAAPERM